VNFSFFCLLHTHDNEPRNRKKQEKKKRKNCNKRKRFGFVNRNFGSKLRQGGQIASFIIYFRPHELKFCKIGLSNIINK